jgi:hypothetical protein
MYTVQSESYHTSLHDFSSIIIAHPDGLKSDGDASKRSARLPQGVFYNRVYRQTLVQNGGILT